MEIEEVEMLAEFYRQKQGNNFVVDSSVDRLTIRLKEMRQTCQEQLKLMLSIAQENEKSVVASLCKVSYQHIQQVTSQKKADLQRQLQMLQIEVETLKKESEEKKLMHV